MIIINEYEYAETCIRNKEIGDSITETLSILARYYFSQGLKKKAVCVELQNFLEVAYPRYTLNKKFWVEYISSTVSKNVKVKLFVSDGIWITKSELERIQDVGNTILGKLAFTLLCIAKINNQRNETDSSWVSMETKEIFKLANISCNNDLRAKRLGDLVYAGLIRFAAFVSDTSIKVLFVDNDSEKKIFIDDFRNLGNEYMYHTGGNYIRCAECGKLIKNNKNGTKKYCSTCASYVPQETKQVTCIDCGKIFMVDAMNNKACRCDECQKKYRNNYQKELMRRKRESC